MSDKKKESLIPDKGRDYVIRHADRILPLMERDGKLLYYRANCDHFTQSFPWASTSPREALGLVEIGRIETLHTWAFYGFFKPTMAEVINQIPEDLIDQVTHVLVKGPETADDLNKNYQLLNEGYHVAETILYRHGIINDIVIKENYE